MSALSATLVQLPSELKTSSLAEEKSSFFLRKTRRRIPAKKNNQSIVPVARLFGPATFDASKLKVLYLGVDQQRHHAEMVPRTYTLTHSDFTSKLTLTISQYKNISQLQGWYSRLQRDEVVGEWKRIKGKMSLHVHCHISGGHFLLDLLASFRYYIFCKELPVVLKAFIHGDKDLLRNYPELEEALVWVYFHSGIPEFDKVECWGPLEEAASPPSSRSNQVQEPCQEACTCCSLPKLGSNNLSRGRLVRR